MLTVNAKELRVQGFTVVRGFCDRASCRAAREAIDAYLGTASAERVPVPKEELGHNGGSGGFTHVVSHPNPILSSMAHYLPQLASVHAASLASEPEHMCLNGQHFIRTDPSDVAPGAKNWHVDNCFLPRHEAATPRRVYTRSILALNKIEKGGAAVMFLPSGVAAARNVVARMVAEQGEDAYDPRDWLPPLQRELIVQDNDPNGSGRGKVLAVRSAGLQPPVECLMDEGDLVIFDAMSLHTASSCSNGNARYVLTSSFHDARALEMPHKLYAAAMRHLRPM